MNEESIRTNLDSAKKRAVLQHMDYDGFHQMVLGANLMPLKRGDAENIFKSANTPMNSIASYNQVTQRGYDEEAVKNFLQIKLDEQLAAPRSQQEFEKYFGSKFQDPMQRYTYLRLMDMENYPKIFMGEFDSELLIKIFQTFLVQVIENPTFSNETEQQFIVEFLKIISATPSFDFSLEFLGKKERELFAKVISGLDKVKESDREQLVKVYKL